METKFTKGEWFIDSSTDICTKENIIGNVICLAPDICCEESLENWPANARLISFAPEMFYRTVLLANSEGWQDAFDLICKITGKEYKYLSDDFNQLVEEAKSFFQH